MNSPEHDVVIFGATGYTGALTAEYLVGRGDGATRVALAGRNRSKLEALRDRLAADLTLVEADVDDPASLQALASSTRVLITTVGPYIKYGEAVVAACAAAGTDYVDLTGEPEFVDRVWLRYHEQAMQTGARIVHCCGFDSIPPTSVCSSPWLNSPSRCRSRSRATCARTEPSPVERTKRRSPLSPVCVRPRRRPPSAAARSDGRQAGG